MKARRQVSSRASGLLTAALCLLVAACTNQPDAPTADVVEDVLSDAPSDTDVVVTDVHLDSAPVGLPPSPLRATGGFIDVSAALAKTLTADPGEKGQRVPYSGIGLLYDHNNDGQTDILLSDGLGRVWLGRATGPWKWQWQSVFEDEHPYTGALAWIDGGDGERRIVIGGSHLHLMTIEGDQWVDKAEGAGLKLPVNVAVQGVTPGDFDDDGLLDLAVSLFTCDDKSRLHIFLGRGDGTFEERAGKLGLDYQGTLWATLYTDVDRDGFTDLLAMAESCPPEHGNAWMRNQGFPGVGLKWNAKALPPVFQSPDAQGGTPMGGSVGDLNSDGLLDYVLSEIGLRGMRANGTDLGKAKPAALVGGADSANHLLLAKAEGGFASVGPQSGIAAALSDTGQPMVSWSTALFDVDFDGHLDLLISHGHDWDSFLVNDAGGMRPVLFRNRGDGTFDDLSAFFGLPEQHLGRPIASADLDGDGDVDLLLGGQTNQPLLLRNDVTHGGQWLAVRLHGTVSNTWGLGALLRLQTQGRTYVAEMSTQAPTHAMEAPLVRFALPAGTVIQALRVSWPSGHEQLVDAPAAGKVNVVVEPPLLTLSKRLASPGESIVVTAQNYSEVGTPLSPSSGVSIELAAGAQGKWLGGVNCARAGPCKRTWLAAGSAGGTDTVVVHFGNKALRVRPKIRY